jgi:hypothetical protein
MRETSSFNTAQIKDTRELESNTPAGLRELKNISKCLAGNIWVFLV